MTALECILTLNDVCFGLWSTEKPKAKASKAEIRRWFDKKSISINGNIVGIADTIDMVDEIILFPKSDKRRTSFRF